MQITEKQHSRAIVVKSQEENTLVTQSFVQDVPNLVISGRDTYVEGEEDDILNKCMAEAARKEPTAEDSDEVKATRKKREDDELLCRRHILNTLTDRLYDLYQNLKSPRVIWTALQSAYENEKRGIDNFISLKYFEFKMVDTKPIMDQIHEPQILVSKLTDLEVKILDALQIGAILSKLPSSWNDYRKKILHSSEKLTVEQFRTRIQIESENRIRDTFMQPLSMFKKAGINFNQGNSGNSGRSEKAKAKMVESSSQGLVAMVSVVPCNMVTELNMVAAAVKSQDWCLDLGATVHVCYEKNMFKTYAEVKEPEKVLMGNHMTADVAGKGSVEINSLLGRS
ncbi:PREDICTED: uncharacterized protein LOC109216748 [Nicotiana attenuata]|uniref:uncharacterized protein LOC109216748 n=1 Tax=Nicotiana attenuata TaxID=49451 RepID=UPI000905D5D6|nr:PREDICTED: uncharacterized protein LOC109216748 [Nicotiana attenuata]